MMSRRSQPTLPALLKRKRRDTDDGEEIRPPGPPPPGQIPEVAIDSSQGDAPEISIQETQTVEAPSEDSVVVISSEDKENECPPTLSCDVPSEDLGCFEVPSSGDEAGYELGSENDDGCTVLSPEPARQTYPLTPIDNCHTWSRFRGSFSQPGQPTERACPLPNLNWADEKNVWERMCAQDTAATERRNPDMFDNHPLLQPRMRSVLLDWLIEVCEVYRLHRETYYLAMDFLDRYLTLTKDLPKTQLQLIGITCLFIAAKMEEIYPPKIQEFAYVTDGACTEADILSKELAIMKCLDWRLSPLTVNYWLNTYMQLVSSHRRVVGRQQRSAAREKLARRVSRSSLGGLCSSPLQPEVQTAHEENLGTSFVYPQFSGLSFSETAQLLDLCTLDAACLHFSYSVLATSALHHTVSRDIALKFSGLQWQDIAICVKWMKPYAVTLAKEGATTTFPSHSSGSPHSSGLTKAVPNIVTDDSHNIQTHSVNLDMLEQAQALLVKLVEDEEVKALGLLTPPSSGCKPLVSHGSNFT
ncbi:G1/S-specific cyclin-E1 isoform X1 [Thrips palmi]|uniref:G1/S-specific cyclin-E1 isoform X1 n=1 Tax=Thrips palmi TaxID=161013 RepID=A0A6P8YRM7_THRPL|nr:G1/S-specific cyclin-E1 isoform X1 [Thrips palmi]XP_034236733.1 G1/S-specific cyclin-E1 isoform X1 [Thrips palmi]